VLSAGPLVAALTAAPAGRGVDRFGAATMTRWGLSGMIAGCLALAVLPTSFGVAGFMAPLVLLTAGYGIFQAANNASVMAEVNAAQRGGVAGLLNLSRNLGRITGASVMGAVFAFATTATDLIAAPPDAIATGMRVTFAVAAVLMAVAISLSIGARPEGSMVKGVPVLSASFPRQLP